MKQSRTLSPKLYFSYGQFMVYDRSLDSPGLNWTEDHSNQGFVRRESIVCFGTSLEFGHADVAFSQNAYVDGDDDRVIAVPFVVTSGVVSVLGPEEWDIERNISLTPGHYRLTAAQRVISDEEGEEEAAIFSSSGSPRRWTAAKSWSLMKA